MGIYPIHPKKEPPFEGKSSIGKKGVKGIDHLIPSLKKGKPSSQELEHIETLYRDTLENWDSLELSDLAERILELEEKMARFQGSSKEIAKWQRRVEDLHFQFLFPIVLELKASTNRQMISFADIIHQMAQNILKDPLFPIDLSPEQMREVHRYAKGGVYDES